MDEDDCPGGGGYDLIVVVEEINCESTVGLERNYNNLDFLNYLDFQMGDGVRIRHWQDSSMVRLSEAAVGWVSEFVLICSDRRVCSKLLVFLVRGVVSELGL